MPDPAPKAPAAPTFGFKVPVERASHYANADTGHQHEVTADGFVECEDCFKAHVAARQVHNVVKRNPMTGQTAVEQIQAGSWQWGTAGLPIQHPNPVPLPEIKGQLAPAE